jgi:hypothetical protein
MLRPAAFLSLILILSTSGASAKTLCIQLDSNGDVFVLKGVGKGATTPKAYLAEYQGGSSYRPRPLSGSSVMESDGSFAAGLTQYGVGINSFAEQITFHRVRCNSGADKKLGVLDTCNDVAMVQSFDNHTQILHPGHVVPCIRELAIE